MKKTFLYLWLLLLSVAFVLPLQQANAAVSKLQDNFYTSYTNFLLRHVRQGQVNYRSIQKDKSSLQKLVQQVGSYDLSESSAAEEKAFYINAYNILVMQQVLEHYPLKSVMDVKGFFDTKKYKVAGQSLTLNQLEKQKLFVLSDDARLHFALVCAAKSCPPLLNEAYTPEKLEQQLQAQAQNTLRSNQFIKVLPKEKKVLVSEIFNWYKDDFLRNSPGILEYINKYRSQQIPANYQLGYYTYNWQLNDIASK